MTTDKTLADVQPGGRVRLGDGDEKPPQELPKLIVTRGDGIPLPDQAAAIEEFKRQRLRRVESEYPHLSAQPSPGGQDALVLEALDYFERAGDAGDRKYVAAIRAALAARQPVHVQGCDELRARTEGERAAYMEGLEEGKKIATRQPVGQIDEAAVLRRAAAVLDMWEGDSNQTGYMGDFKDAQAILEVLAQNAASPPQAVDLGQFRPAVELMEWQERGHANPDFPRGDAKKHAEALRLLALIDKAVGK